MRPVHLLFLALLMLTASGSPWARPSARDDAQATRGAHSGEDRPMDRGNATVSLAQRHMADTGAHLFVVQSGSAASFPLLVPLPLPSPMYDESWPG